MNERGDTGMEERGDTEIDEMGDREIDGRGGSQINWKGGWGKQVMEKGEEDTEIVRELERGY